jgi:DNA replication protein DnaC
MTEWQNRNLHLRGDHPKLKEMADHAQNLAKWFAANDACAPCVLVICGDSGTGKTHTARALYNWAREKSGRLPVSVEFHSWPETCDAVSEGYTGIMRDLMEADFLALDDIGAETDKYKTGEMVDKLCQVLSRRENKYTVITTNVSPDRWNAKFDARITDRLLRNSTVCDLVGVPSYAVQRMLKAA